MVAIVPQNPSLTPEGSQIGVGVPGRRFAQRISMERPRTGEAEVPPGQMQNRSAREFTMPPDVDDD
jgi:hypothetical protein